MKKITIILIALLTCNAARSQNKKEENTYNFAIKSGKLVWQKVYNDTTTMRELISICKQHPYIYSISEIDESSFACQLVKLPIDFKSLGKRAGFTPVYIVRSTISAKILIEIKEGRYRVTLAGLTLTQRYSDPLAPKGTETELDLYALKKKNTLFSLMFLDDGAPIFDYNFDKLLEKREIKAEQETQSDEW